MSRTDLRSAAARRSRTLPGLHMYWAAVLTCSVLESARCGRIRSMRERRLYGRRLLAVYARAL
eukprot:1949008-Rhodomonas_salina.3